MTTWGIEQLPGGIKLQHLPCGQYRSFHGSEWAGLIADAMHTHSCPATPERLWFDAGNNTRISIRVPAGPILENDLGVLAHTVRYAGDGEVLRFTYQWTDLETDEPITGAARLMIEPLPDPRGIPDSQNPHRT